LPTSVIFLASPISWLALKAVSQNQSQKIIEKEMFRFFYSIFFFIYEQLFAGITSTTRKF